MPSQRTLTTIDYTTQAARDAADVTIVQVDRRYTIISDAMKGVWYWDGSTTVPQLLLDLVPYLPKNDGSSSAPNASLPLAQCPPVTPGHFITHYRNRLWLVDPDRSRLRYSGTRTDLSTSESEPRTIKPWELWNQKMDLSRYNPAYGGSLIIGDVKQRITGLVGTDNGMLVFKENSVYVLQYPDSAAPHEATEGATVKKFIDNIGAIHQSSIVQMGDDVIFLAKDSRGQYSVQAITGEGLKPLSLQIDSELQNLRLDYHRPLLQVVGTYLYIAYDNGDTYLKIRHGFDMVRNAWFDMTSPRIVSMEPSQSSGKLLLTTDTGHILVYPSTSKQDFNIDNETNNNAIPWLIKTRRWDFGEPLVDKKFRKFWAGVESGGPLDISLRLLYNDDSTEVNETESIVNGVNDVSVPINKRAKNILVEVSGNASQKLNIHSLKVGARKRSVK